MRGLSRLNVWIQAVVLLAASVASGAAASMLGVAILELTTGPGKGMGYVFAALLDILVTYPTGAYLAATLLARPRYRWLTASLAATLAAFGPAVPLFATGPLAGVSPDSYLYAPFVASGLVLLTVTLGVYLLGVQMRKVDRRLNEVDLVSVE